MKSSIKVDLTLDGNPIININAYDGWEDLRDKTLNMFLNKIKPNGRLCFIDSSGSKNSDSFGGEFRPYTITPINPYNYELLIKEIELLIKERDERFPALALTNKEKFKNITESEFNDLMNY